MSLADRNARIVELRRQGDTLSTIAEAVGLTPARVRQVLAEAGGPTTQEAARVRAEQAGRARDEAAARVAAAALEHPAASVEALARMCRLDRATVLEMLPARERRRRQDVLPAVTGSTMYARPLALVAGRNGSGPLTARSYDRLRDPDHPSSARVRQVFGTWAAATRAAGLGVNGTVTRRGARWDVEQVMSWVDTYLADPAATFTYRDLDTWLRGQDDAPSAQTVRNVTGMNWSQILSAGNTRAARRGA